MKTKKMIATALLIAGLGFSAASTPANASTVSTTVPAKLRGHWYQYDKYSHNYFIYHYGVHHFSTGYMYHKKKFAKAHVEHFSSNGYLIYSGNPLAPEAISKTHITYRGHRYVALSFSTAAYRSYATRVRIPHDFSHSI